MLELRTGALALFTLGLIGAVAQGCGGSDCVSLCQESEDRDCKTLRGDCTNVCNAGENLAEKADCDEQRVAYLDCVAEDDVCSADARCQSRLRSFFDCATPYCLANQSDGDCQTIVDAFF